MSTVSNKISFGAIDTNVENRLGFKPDATINGGLCIAKILSVELNEHDVPKQDDEGVPSSWEFAGLKTFSLDITYMQVANNPKDKSERFIVQRETIPSTNKKNGEAIDVKTWSNLTMGMFGRLQHIVNAMDKGGLVPKSKAIGAIDVSYEDSAEIRLSKFKKVLEHFYVQITGLPVVVKEGTEVGKPKYDGIQFWLKVIADATRGTFYVVPAFVGKGFIEVKKAGETPTLELAPSDVITLSKAVKKGAKADMNYSDADASGVQGGAKSAADVLKDLGIS